MLYGFECDGVDGKGCEFGGEIPIGRLDLGYTLCLKCGDIKAKARRFTIVPMHKSNYVAVFNRSDLLGINNKGGLVK